ncbi:MAG: hypothetical protein ACMG57_00735 [Candidatus Dojkabacteria bacterium]
MELPAKMKIYGEEFKFFADKRLQAYYHLDFANFSEKLNRDHYICHIVLLIPFRITNYESIFEIEDQAIEELFVKKAEITKDNSVFSLFVEFTEGASIIPDLNMIRNINKRKKSIEKKRNVLLNYAVAIVPKKFGKTYKIFKFVTKYFSGGEEMGIVVHNYEEAMGRINAIDNIMDAKNFEKAIG